LDNDQFSLPFTQQILADGCGLSSVHLNRTVQAPHIGAFQRRLPQRIKPGPRRSQNHFRFSPRSRSPNGLTYIFLNLAGFCRGEIVGSGLPCLNAFSVAMRAGKSRPRWLVSRLAEFLNQVLLDM
jgi:hypothetical protein